jgi:hypothetical protein
MPKLHRPCRKPLVFSAMLLFLVGGAPLATGAETSEDVGAERPWSVAAGIGVGYLDDDAESCAGDCSSRFEVDARLSPFLRIGYSWSGQLSSELDLRWDAYRWGVDNTAGDGQSSFWSYTVATGLAYLFASRDLGFLGRVRPVAKAAVGLRFPDADLDAPVRDYDPGPGFELSAGLLKGNFDWRLGYSCYRHPAGDRQSSATRTQTLVLDDVFVEVTYRLGTW